MGQPEPSSTAQRTGQVLIAALWLMCVGVCEATSAPPDPLAKAKEAIRVKQFAAAAGELQRLAQAGNPDAQYLLAVFYMNGLNGPRDEERARPWLEKSAAAGNRAAALSLSRLHGGTPVIEVSRPEGLVDPAVRNEALWLAARHGDLKSVQALSDTSSVNSKDEFGRGALARAAEAGQAEVADLLVRAGAAVNAADGYGTTPLMIAARAGHAATVAVLLGAGANSALADRAGNTALMHAAAAGDLQSVEHLLAGGADVKARNVQGWTALDFADAAGSVLVAEKLVQSGAAGARHAHASSSGGSLVRAKSPERDLYSGWSDVAVAASRSSPAMLDGMHLEPSDLADAEAVSEPLLVATRADAPKTVESLLVRAKGRVRPERGAEALLLAVRSGEDQVLGVLLSNGVSPDVRAQDGEPAILAAARAGRTNIVRMLTSSHANAGLQDRSGTSALMLAAAQANLEMIQVLLEAGAPVDQADKVGRTALWYASRADDAKGALALLQQGADLNHADSSGVSALGAACIAGSASTVQLLLARGANVEARTRNGDSPLLLAAARGRLDIVDKLLGARADKDAQNKFGDTALIIASRNGDLPVVKRMLAAGAATRIRNADRETAADVAEARAFHNVAELFKS